MKKRNLAAAIVILLCSMPALLFAQQTPVLTLQANQGITPGTCLTCPDNLVITVSTYLNQSGGSQQFVWNSSDFVLNFDTNALDYRNINILQQGKWSDRDSQYEKVEVTKGIGNYFVVRIKKKALADPLKNTPPVPLNSALSGALVVQFSVPTKNNNCTGASGLSWRRNLTIPSAATVRAKGSLRSSRGGIDTNVIANSAGFNVVYKISGSDKLHPTITPPQIKAKGLPNHISFIWPAIPNARKYRVRRWHGDHTLWPFDQGGASKLPPNGVVIAAGPFAGDIYFPADFTNKLKNDTILLDGLANQLQFGCAYLQVTAISLCDSLSSAEATACPKPCTVHKIAFTLDNSLDSNNHSFCAGSDLTIRVDTHLVRTTFDTGNNEIPFYSIDGVNWSSTADSGIFHIPGAGKYPTTHDTTYTVSVRDQYGCPAASASVQVHFRKLYNTATVIHLNEGADSIHKYYCAGQLVRLHYNVLPGEDIIAYKWSTNGNGTFINSRNQTASDTANPIYYVTSQADITAPVNFTLRYDCYNMTATESTIVNPQPKADFTVKNSIGKGKLVVGDEITFDATYFPTNLAGTYTWNFGDGTSVTNKNGTAKHTYSLANSYPASLIVRLDNGGCHDSTGQKIDISSLNDVFVPSAFAPFANTNKENQSVKVYGKGIQSSGFSFVVFSRWGELVYQTDNFTTANSEGWNGKKNNSGEDLPLGTYTFAVKGKYSDGTVFEKTGNVTLIK